jgi:hypothetical protein
MKKFMFLISCLGAALLQTAFGQQDMSARNPNDTVPEWVRRNEQKRDQMDKLAGRDENGMIADRPDFRNPRLHPTKADGKPYTKEELERIEALKKPGEADLAKYADFLKQSKTGMFRLFPFLACVEKNLIRVDAECADFIPDSAGYSFRLRDYNDQNFYDVKSKDGQLVTGSMLSLGVLTALGDAPLESVSLTSDGMKFLAQLKPETGQKEAEKQIDGFLKGVEADGYKYSTKLKIEENTTYGLRVVAYRMPDNVALVLGDDSVNSAAAKFSYPLNRFDKRDDIIVAFRIIRRDAEDGNVTILWKELSRTDAPKLVFPKDVKSVIVKAKAG